MFGIEESISEWRHKLSRAGIAPETVDELTAHLRDEIASLIRDGSSEESAFNLATSRLGSPKSLRCEFQKSTQPQRKPVNIITALWFACVASFAIYVLWRIRGDGNPDSLLGVHILSLMIGYITAVIAGGFGMGLVALRWLNRSTPLRREALMHGLRRFNLLAALFVLSGLAAGLLWNSKHFAEMSGAPPYPEVIAIQIVLNLREYGSHLVAFWLIATVTVQFYRPATSALIPLCILGNLLVGLAWFGPSLYMGDLHHYGGTNTAWPVYAIMILHAIFLALAFVRRDRQVEISAARD